MPRQALNRAERALQGFLVGRKLEEYRAPLAVSRGLSVGDKKYLPAKALVQGKGFARRIERCFHVGVGICFIPAEKRNLLLSNL